MLYGMITFLEGILVEAYPTHVVLNVHGVGYHVAMPLSSYDRLPAVGTRFQLLTHLQIREDAHVLFGFATAQERDLFRLLINHVSGIGPKTALDVLSGVSVSSFKAAVVAGDSKSLSQVKGIGKKTAERIIVELRDKVGVSAAWEAASASHSPAPRETEMNDAMLALIALGYKQVDAVKALKTVGDTRPGEEIPSDELVREALKRLA
jgi:Holliday junction DNA helicase RuvA